MVRRLSLFIPFLAVVWGQQFTLAVPEEEEELIRRSSHSRILSGRALQSSTEATCEYDSSKPNDNSCSLQSLQATGDQRFGVYPGGQTRCGLNVIPETGELNPYFFQVDPGRNGQENNLLLAFQGGGAFLGFDVEQPDARVTPKFFDGGMFDLDRQTNPFRDWTRVVITYCTGDIHAGDGIDTDANGNEYVFNGRKNTVAVLTWVARNLPNPDRVFIYGSSAGSSAVHLWSNRILSYFKTLQKPPIMAVVMDSSTGLTRQVDGNPGPSVATALWKICSPELGLTPDEIELCEQGLFSSPDFQSKSQANHRGVPFAYANFKFDRVLYDGYCGANDRNCVEPDEFYRLTKEYLRGFVQETDNNILTYWVNSQGHVMGNSNRLYNIVEGIPLVDWIANLATHDDGSPAVLASDCVEADVSEGFDASCDPVLLAASFFSAGGPGAPSSSPPPLPPSDDEEDSSGSSRNGPTFFWTRPSAAGFNISILLGLSGLLVAPLLL